MEGSWSRVQSSGSGVQGLGFRVWGSGSGVQGLGGDRYFCTRLLPRFPPVRCALGIRVFGVWGLVFGVWRLVFGVWA